MQFGDRRPVGNAAGVSDANNPNLQVEAQAGAGIKVLQAPVRVLTGTTSYGVFLSLLSRSQDMPKQPCSLAVSFRNDAGITQRIGVITPEFNDRFSFYRFTVQPQGDYSVIQLDKPEECSSAVLSVRSVYAYPLVDAEHTEPAREGLVSFTAFDNPSLPDDYLSLGKEAAGFTLNPTKDLLLGKVQFGARIVGTGGKGKYRLALYERRGTDAVLLSQTSFSAAEADSYYRVGVDLYAVPIPAKLQAGKEYVIGIDGLRVVQSTTHQMLFGQQKSSNVVTLSVRGKKESVRLGAFVAQLYVPVFETTAAGFIPDRLQTLPIGLSQSRLNFSFHGTYFDCLNSLESGSNTMCFEGIVTQLAASDEYIYMSIPINGTIQRGSVSVTPKQFGARLRDLEVQYKLNDGEWEELSPVRTSEKTTYSAVLKNQVAKRVMIRVRATPSERAVTERGEGEYIGLDNLGVELTAVGGVHE